MTITCAKCGHQLKSLDIDQSKAWVEVYGLFTKHIQRQHHNELNLLAQGLMKVSMALSVVLTMDEFGVVAVAEEYINKHLEESRDLVMLALGFDPEEEIEDGGGGDTEDTEDDEENEASDVLSKDNAVIDVKENEDATQTAS